MTETTGEVERSKDEILRKRLKDLSDQLEAANKEGAGDPNHASEWSYPLEGSWRFEYVLDYCDAPPSPERIEKMREAGIYVRINGVVQ